MPPGDGRLTGFLEFDLTTDPITYRSQIITRDLNWPITHTCPDSENVRDNAGVTVWVETRWADTSLEGAFGPDFGDSFSGSYNTGSDSGRASGFWWFDLCGDLGCGAWDPENEGPILLDLIEAEELGRLVADSE